MWGERGNFLSDSGIKVVQALLTSACRLLEKLKVYLLALLLLGMHPKEPKSKYKGNNSKYGLTVEPLTKTQVMESAYLICIKGQTDKENSDTNGLLFNYKEQ